MYKIIFIYSVIVFSFGCGSVKNSEKSTSKPGSDIVDKYWKLIEINGHRESSTTDTGKEAHMMLKRKENRVEGNGGCNSYSGKFEIQAGNQIKLSEISATKMACLHHHHENDFFKLLLEINAYTIRDDILSLHRGQASASLKFQLVASK